MVIKKYINKNCSECNKEIRIRSDYINKHKGKCHSCINREVMNRPERRQINLNSLIGRKHSEETRLKRSLSLKGRKRPLEVIERIRKSNTGKKRTPEQLLKLSMRMKGKRTRLGCKLTDEQRKKLSDAHKTPEYIKKYGRENNWNWKGGSGKLLFDIRSSVKSIQWRKDIFLRDKFTCVFCKEIGGKSLNAHHIHRFKDMINEYNIKTYEDAMNCEELWNIDNGITLCNFCHIHVHKGEWRKKKNDRF